MVTKLPTFICDRTKKNKKNLCDISDRYDKGESSDSSESKDSCDQKISTNNFYHQKIYQNI